MSTAKSDPYLYDNAMQAATDATDQQRSPIFLRHSALWEKKKGAGDGYEAILKVRTNIRFHEVRYQVARVEELTGITRHHGYSKDTTGQWWESPPDMEKPAVELQSSPLQRRTKREDAERGLIEAYQAAGHSKPDAVDTAKQFADTVSTAVQSVVGRSI